MTFSIVIPAYNGEQFIEAAILSALSQSRPADEIIVSDDNSTDKTLSICKKYNDKVQIYTNIKGPSGFVNGWNNALKKATGDFISILHQDDLLHPDFLLSAEVLLKQYLEVKHLFASCNYIDNNGETTNRFPEQDRKYKLFSGLEYVKAYQARYDNMPHVHRCPGVLTHRSIFDRCVYNSDAGHIADDDFFYRVAKLTPVIGILEPLAFYRIHQTSETSSLGGYGLVKRLSNDYLYQVNQWKGDSFLDDMAYTYFVDNTRKYIKRQIGYALKKFDVNGLVSALYLRKKLNQILKQ